jgi:hypothetical protein
VTSEQALKDIQGFAGANRITFTKHARERMAERGASLADVREALLTAKSCSAGDKPGKWIVPGADLDGDDLTVVCVIESGVVVITVY